MAKKGLNCDCEGWQVGFNQICAAQAMESNRAAGARYTGKIFAFCPWCGRSVKEEDQSDNRMKKLDDISRELGKIANSYALEKKGGVGCRLHEASNNIIDAQKIIKGEAEASIPMEFIMRSMGLGHSGTGVSMADLMEKDEQYKEDLENEENG